MPARSTEQPDTKMNYFSSSSSGHRTGAPASGFSRIILRRNDQANGRPSDDDVEHQPLSPRPESPEMAERRQPRFTNMRRPTVPSMFRFSSSTEATTTTSTSTSSRWPGANRPNPNSNLHHSHPHPTPRPSSSHYPDEEDDDNRDGHSPKTTERPYSIVVDLPSTRLHLPGLQRTWTQGSNGPPTSRPPVLHVHHEPQQPRAPTAAATAASVSPPMPPIPAAHVRGRRHDDTDELYDATDDERSRGFHGADPAETQLAELAEDGRRRRERSGSNRSRRHRHLHAHERGGSGGSGSGERHRRSRRRHGGGSSGLRRLRDIEDGDTDRSDRPHPKHFLFCFPWVKSRRVRKQILQCFVSGLFLILLLTVYLALSVTKNIANSEFTVLLILIILFATIFFCHGLIRLCMLIMRPRRSEDRTQLPQMYGPGGYAIPRQPIRVVLARDEEAAGIESETTKISPPAYGLWRESVRVDPNRIYWKRNSQARDADGAIASVSENEEESSSSSDSRPDGGDGTRRPPSYASEDGVSYIVEARPRSMAPPDDIPLPPHPSEAGYPVMPPMPTMPSRF